MFCILSRKIENSFQIMTTFTLKQHEEDLKTLEKRLDSVERGVCDALNNDRFIIETASITNLAERIETLVVKYREIENENDNIKQLVEKYMEYESFLEKEIDESPSIHTSEKKAILLSAFEDFHRIQHQLSEVQHLKEYVLGTNANPIKDLKALELHVSKVEVNTGHLLQDCIIFKRNLDQFLDEYDVQVCFVCFLYAFYFIMKVFLHLCAFHFLDSFDISNIFSVEFSID